MVKLRWVCGGTCGWGGTGKRVAMCQEHSGREANFLAPLFVFMLSMDSESWPRNASYRVVERVLGTER